MFADRITGGSRERLLVSLAGRVNRLKTRYAIAIHALGRSREPLVFTRFGRTSDGTKVARVEVYRPNRLPSLNSSPLTLSVRTVSLKELPQDLCLCLPSFSEV